MIPQNLNYEADTDETSANEIESEPDLTYRIVNGEVVAGTIDGIEAVKQSIAIMLNVERYEHEIYSWQYGTEFEDLIGTDASLACPEISRRITEALMTDERITDVYDFAFEQSGSAINCSFTVKSVYGEISSAKEVSI